VSLAATRALFTELLAKLILKGNESGMHVGLDEGRVFVNRRVVADGQTKWVKDAVHKNGSLHYSGLAADLVIWDQTWGYVVEPEPYIKLGGIWRSLDPMCTWGGDFANLDYNHFSFGEGL